MHRVWRTFYCLKIIIEASKNLPPNIHPGSSFPQHTGHPSSAHSVGHPQCCPRGRGRVRWGGSWHPGRCAVRSVSCVGGLVPAHRALWGEDSPAPPPRPGSREAVIVILSHLFGELQVLLLTLPPLLGREPGRCRGPQMPPIPLPCLRGPRLPASHSPLRTLGPCCRIWEEIAWPGDSGEAAVTRCPRHQALLWTAMLLADTSESGGAGGPHRAGGGQRGTVSAGYGEGTQVATGTGPAMAQCVLLRRAWQICSKAVTSLVWGWGRGGGQEGKPRSASDPRPAGPAGNPRQSRLRGAQLDLARALVRWWAHLDRHVVDVQAEGDALVEGQLRLPRGVDVDRLLGLYVALLVVDAGLDDTITDGLQAPGGAVTGRPVPHVLSCTPSRPTRL